MSTTYFHVQKHVIAAQHIRQYPRATANIDEDELEIAIKQYTPLDNPDPQPGDVTIIAAHANGVMKELYEPLWDELYAQSHQTGKFKIRSIWIADVAWQGESGVINEDKLGVDPSWFDHSRDLLHMVNTFRKQMVPPIVGWGHSLGVGNIVQLSLMHPRLFAGLVLYEPVIQREPSKQGSYMPAYMSTFRRDSWPTREYAVAKLRENLFYQNWDERCLDKLVQYGFRSLPTALYPEYVSRSEESKAAEPAPTDPVTLTTTKHNEVFTFLRPNFPESFSDEAIQNHKPRRETHPDVPPDGGITAPFYRPEPILLFRDLDRVRPRCLYIFGELSPLSETKERNEKLKTTGTGVGGSGGMNYDGAVSHMVLDAGGHFFPFEMPQYAAARTGYWLGEELKRWKAEREEEEREWEAVKRQKDGLGGKQMSDQFVQWMRRNSELHGITKQRQRM